MKDKTKYLLPLPGDNCLKIAKGWLILAISSLAVGGLFSLPPVILRKTYFKDIGLIEKIFSTSLVVHVNLTVIVWLLSICCFLWSLKAESKHRIFYWTALIIAAFGATFIAISPFIASGAAIKNNYVPMLTNPAFIFGLALFACGVIFQVGLTLINIAFFKDAISRKYAQSFGLYSAAIITAVAFLCFFLSGLQIKSGKIEFSGIESYYESVFWAGGHILQFTFTQVMVIAWLWILSSINATPNISARLSILVFYIPLAFIVPTPILYSYFNIDDPKFINFFTIQMIVCTSIVPTIFLPFILKTLLTKKVDKGKIVERNTLIMSLLLFFTGGVLGLLIRGSNVTIPAHYHGSIVGVSLAFMAVVYDFLPRLGYGKIGGKAAYLQPFIYGGGQLLHIIGLAVMGGYGALRKAPGTSASVDTIIGKTMFFAGGSLAIIGGLMFVYIAFSSLIKTSKN